MAIDLEEARRLHREQGRKLREAERRAGAGDFRARDAERQRENRATRREVVLHAPVDLDRRRACIADPLLFMATYFGWIFSEPFTDSRRAMADCLVHAARYAGDYAVAAGRGSGKSAIALFTTFWLTIRRETVLPLLIGKNQKGAEDELSNLKQAIVESPLFSDDFPEICLPIIALDDWASAARKQTVYGERTKIGWQKDCIFLPTVSDEMLRHVPGWPEGEPSYACGQGLAVVGVDGKVRGFKRRNTRPRLAVFDDIDDRESAHSASQTADKRKAIDQDAIGLAGSGQRTSRAMLCTTINDQCIAAIYTALPNWRGQRFRAITTMPPREDLRDQYVEMRRGRSGSDPDARVAHRWYLDHQADIEAGGLVDNPYDFVGKPSADGTPLEVSPFQHYFNLIADVGMPAFLCEWQNDPPKSDEELDQLLLTASRIQHSLSGLEQRHAPAGTVAITIGADVQKLGLYYVAVAWAENGAGAVIDYGVAEFMTEGKKAADCELLILEGLLNWQSHLEEHPFLGPATDEFPDGEPKYADLVLIDMGWKEKTWSFQPVTQFCAQAGAGRFMPSKGSSPYHRPQQTRHNLVGNQWHINNDNGLPVAIMDADHWKLKVQEAFLAEAGQPGSLLLFNPPELEGRRSRTAHLSYAKHILAERWDTARSRWTVIGAQNHYFDATYAAIVGRSIKGINVLPAPKRLQEPKRPAVISAGRSNYARW